MAYTIQSFRRQHQRFYLDAQATLTDDLSGEVVAILKDISSHGAGVISTRPIEPNAIVELQARSPFFFEKHLKSKGKVLRCEMIDERLWDIGIDFGFDRLRELEGN